MIDPPVPKLQWGQRVKATIDLFNDGSFPESPAEALLVKIGDEGEIVRVGTHTEANIPVYLVDFGGKKVIGCLETELSPA